MLTFTKGINLDFFHILKKYLYQRNCQLKVNNCFFENGIRAGYIS